VVRETALFMQRLGESPDLNASNMKGIRQKCLLLVGDKDATAGVDATRKAAMCLENAAFQVLSDTPHVWDKVNTVRRFRR
jgi:hypothetical protein